MTKRTERTKKQRKPSFDNGNSFYFEAEIIRMYEVEEYAGRTGIFEKIRFDVNRPFGEHDNFAAFEAYGNVLDYIEKEEIQEGDSVGIHFSVSGFSVDEKDRDSGKKTGEQSVVNKLRCWKIRLLEEEGEEEEEEQPKRKAFGRKK